jgi:hypothetical protein
MKRMQERKELFRTVMGGGCRARQYSWSDAHAICTAKIMRHTIVVLAAVGLAACGGSSSPSSPDSPRVLLGQTVNAIDGSARPSLSVQVGTHGAVTSDSNGHFEVDVGGQGTYRTVVRGGSIVERETRLSGPTTERLRLSLIPSNFDLGAFDEMFRTSNSRLQRWTSRPALVVIATVMTYRNGNTDTYEAAGEQLADDEVNEMVAHMTEGLGLLTGNTYTSFASVDIERPAGGTQVNVGRNGRIVVGRYNGIVSLARTIGYGQWAEMPDGTVVAGAMFLDRDFDRNDSRRRLLRIHELGHALGYLHVTSRTSVMNPAIGPEPTDFDRSSAIIAFQRPVGNRTPDVDPAGSGGTFGVVESGAAPRWSTPTVCK